MSQKELAERLGVNQATVSRSLRGDPRIPEGTRRRVQEAARAAGYQADAAVSRMAARRWRASEQGPWGAIAWVLFPHPRSGGYHRRAADEASVVAGQHGYRYEIIEVPAKQRPENLARVLLNRGYDGIVLGRVYEQDFVDRFPFVRLTCVSCEEGFVHLPCDHVQPDLRAPYEKLWRRLMERGYRRVGAVLLKEPQATDLFDKLAILNQLARQLPDLQMVEPIVEEAFFVPGAGSQQRIQSWMAEQAPDVILGFNDAVYWRVIEAGLRVPEDVAFVSLIADPDHPEISGIDISYGKLAETAIERLDRLIRRYQKGPPANRLTMLVEPGWVEGDTLPVRDGRLGTAALDLAQ